jgi:hypothetical protein
MRDAVKFLQQVEDNVRLELGHGVANDAQVVADTDRPSVMFELAQRIHDVELGLPLEDFLFGMAVQALGRNQALVHQDERSQLFHKA